MSDNATQTYILSGTSKQIEDFIEVLRQTPDTTPSHVTNPKPKARSLTQPAPMGQVEIMEVLVHFLVASAAHTAVHFLIIEKFDQFRKSHPNMQLKPPPSTTNDNEDKSGQSVDKEAP